MRDPFTMQTFIESLSTPASRVATLMTLAEPLPIYCECGCDCIVGWTEHGAITKEQLIELLNKVAE